MFNNNGKPRIRETSLRTMPGDLGRMRGSALLYLKKALPQFLNVRQLALPNRFDSPT
jgi:hypothetical protein